MTTRRHLLAAALIGAALALPAGGALADQYLGSYVARLSWDDHHASDGYRLDTAAQVVRQDRANVHRFGIVDREDQDDPWFRSANARARLESMLNRPSAMSDRTRRAIMRGEPLVEVEVYRSSVRVQLLR
ncbi:hypothetical protein N1F89_18850 [Aquibium sp. A9E412]|uniref:hypothetical protein n=1 Tax=Aquibium sp. A9E412 TaxID=2976767 RepID=UPI0025AF4DFF|nr:hypothetical protein [Aquibium sp. A9E412]MDN2568288.1 hypothetical protein [Aquibium sp. A9E412]